MVNRRWLGWLGLVLVGCSGGDDPTATTDTGTPVVDEDRDGYPADQDCDDGAVDVNPGEEEVFGDGIDNDCDLGVDCEDPELAAPVPMIGPVTEEEFPWVCDGWCNRAIVGVPAPHFTPGDLYLADGDGDLTALTCVTSIERDLRLTGTAMSSLTGLDGLTTIGGALVITDNLALTDLSALSALTTVGGDVTITGNTALTDAAAQALVDGIDSIGGVVTISGN